MLVLEVIVISRVKILIGISMEFMESLDEDANKKKGQFLYIRTRAAQNASSSNLLDTNTAFTLDTVLRPPK